MTTVIIDNKSRTGRRLLKDIERHPRIAQIVDERDNTPLPVPEEELISLQEFKEHFEKRIFERLGMKITL
ncbi:MAG: hypothetical protein LBN11_03510 [Tannerella sp.]|jgi:hypothetical protein|nr:hypothetical protein [Tannerella sp.]